MSSNSDIQAMLDDVYGVEGVAARWTPAGGAGVVFTGLIGGGDQALMLHGAVGQPIMSTVTLTARVSELQALAPNAVPTTGDAVDLLDDAGAVIQALQITSAPERRDPRRLEWTFALDPA